MRTLFIATPAIGHAFPMVPLAWALRAAGHEVVVATAGDGLALSDAGLPVVDLLPGFDRRAMLARLRRERPELVEERLHARLDDLRRVVPWFAGMSARLADAAAPVADRWRPDLVVQSQLQGAGLVLAGRLGIPLVTHGFGFARTGALAGLFREHMAEVFDRHGVTAPPDRHVLLDVAPPSMLEQPPDGWSMRFVPYNGGGTLPDWLRAPAARPRIAVTLGTVAAETVGLAPVRRVLELAGDVDAEFVLALGSTPGEDLGPLPCNVRTAGWVPLAQLLPGCTAVIHHGGAGTTLTALACGTPQLILPSGADRHINAAAVQRRGAGVRAEALDLTAGLLQQLCADPDLRRAARQVQDEMATLPSPVDIARRLERLAAGTRQA